jgi:hypothetical protein
MEPIMIPDFSGQTVTRLRIDYRLQLWTDQGWQFNLEGRTVLVSRDVQLMEIEVGIHLDDKDLPESLKQLEGKKLDGVMVSAGGDLALNFADAQVSVQADPRYESWQIHGPRGEIVVCMPGGELAIWGPRV